MTIDHLAAWEWARNLIDEAGDLLDSIQHPTAKVGEARAKVAAARRLLAEEDDER